MAQRSVDTRNDEPRGGLRGGLSAAGAWLRAQTSGRGRAATEKVDQLESRLHTITSRLDEIVAVGERERELRQELDDMRRDIAASFAAVEQQLRSEATRNSLANTEAVEQVTSLTPMINDLAGKVDGIAGYSADQELRYRSEIVELHRHIQSNFAVLHEQLQDDGLRGVQDRFQVSEQLSLLAPLLLKMVDKFDHMASSTSELEQRLGEELEQTRESMRLHFGRVEANLQNDAARSVRATRALSEEIAGLAPIIGEVSAKTGANNGATPLTGELVSVQSEVGQQMAAIREQVDQELDDIRLRTISSLSTIEDHIQHETAHNAEALAQLNSRMDQLFALLIGGGNGVQQGAAGAIER